MTPMEIQPLHSVLGLWRFLSVGSLPVHLMAAQTSKRTPNHGLLRFFLLLLVVFLALIRWGSVLPGGQGPELSPNTFGGSADGTNEIDQRILLKVVEPGELMFPQNRSVIELDLVNTSDDSIWFPDTLNIYFYYNTITGTEPRPSFFPNMSAGQELILYPEGAGQSSFRIVLRPNPAMGLTSGDTLNFGISVTGHIIESGQISDSRTTAVTEITYEYP